MESEQLITFLKKKQDRYAVGATNHDKCIKYLIHLFYLCFRRFNVISEWKMKYQIGLSKIYRKI